MVDEEQDDAVAVKAMEECSGLAQLVVPMTDVLARLGLVGDARAEEFFSYLSHLADEDAEGRALHGVIIALREYREALEL